MRKVVSGFSMPKPTLDLDQAVIERDQHARVAVPEVVQRRPWRIELCPLDRTLERVTCDLPLEAGAVSARKHERVLIEARAARVHEREHPAHQVRRDVDKSA